METTIKQLAIVSGKGGTGKTSLAASISKLAGKHILVDGDVDASNLHILMHPVTHQEIEFHAEKKAYISPDRCRGCGDCVIYCRFNAIKDFYIVNSVICEGCAVCAMMCPYEAIDMVEHTSGTIFIATANNQPMFFAQMGIGEGNSGKLVTELRNKALSIASSDNYMFIIIDGPPGIGCPVIASITGTSHVLIITEPTLSGIHDLERIIKLTQHFRIPTTVCINKYDISIKNTDEIILLCNKYSIEVIGKIPLDTDFVKAQIAGKTIVEFSKGNASQAIQEIWDSLQVKLFS